MNDITSPSAMPWDDSAVLVWGPAGAMPGISQLEAEFVQTPPHPNPVPFWRFRDAVDHAGETLMNGRHNGKAPWIKVGARLFAPDDISAYYRQMRSAGGTEI